MELFSNNLIINWGIEGSGKGTKTITFPLSFSTKAAICVLTEASGATGSTSGGYVYILSLNSVDIVKAHSTDYFVAIGY